jgi:hypothetical protein
VHFFFRIVINNRICDSASWDSCPEATVIIYLAARTVIYCLRLCKSLHSVVVSVLTTGPKSNGLKPGRGDVFLRAIKIRSTTSFR